MVTFTYKDYRAGSTIREMTLSAREFVRRFLLHIVPKNFTRIRHYGFLANAVKKVRIRVLCQITHTASKGEYIVDKIRILTRLIGCDPRICPVCGTRLKTPYSVPLRE